MPHVPHYNISVLFGVGLGPKDTSDNRKTNVLFKHWFMERSLKINNRSSIVQFGTNMCSLEVTECEANHVQPIGLLWFLWMIFSQTSSMFKSQMNGCLISVDCWLQLSTVHNNTFAISQEYVDTFLVKLSSMCNPKITPKALWIVYLCWHGN